VFDLYYYSLNLKNGQSEGRLPGLLAETAPRAAARTRSQDLLCALLTFGEEFVPPPEQINVWLAEASSLYFTTPG